MNIILSGRNIDITPAIRSYAEEKIGKFDRYVSNIAEANVTLSVEKYRHKAEVFLRVNGVKIQAESETEEIYSSIDLVIEKLERQIKKHKDKLVSKRKHEKPSEIMASEAAKETAKSAPEGGPVIIAEQTGFKPMSAEEASMQLEVMGRDFFVFTNERSGAVNVIYRRKDGNFGLMEPAG